MWKRLGYALAVIVVVPIIVWGLSYWLGASPSDRAALSLMEKPWRPAGRNAFPAIWLASYPVPADELDGAMEADLRAFAERPHPVAVASGNQIDVQHFKSGAAARWPQDAVPAVPLCTDAAASCLDHVRAHRQALSAWAAASQVRIARIGQAASGDYLKPMFPGRIDAPIANFPPLREPLTAYAVRFVDGDTRGALAATCALARDWRRLRPQSATLIYAMLANGYHQLYSGLAAEMLAELPAGAVLPAECEAAFSVPEPAEASMCTALRGEFAYTHQMLDADLDAGLKAHGAQVDDAKGVYDPATTRALIAAHYAPYCDPENEARLARDQPLPASARPSPWRLVCVANAAGCMLASVSDAPFAGFSDRVRDQVAMSRLMAGMLWLRRHPGLLEAPERIVAALPRQFRSAGHPLRYDAATRALVMEMSGGKRTSVPLPASRTPATR